MREKGMSRERERGDMTQRQTDGERSFNRLVVCNFTGKER